MKKILLATAAAAPLLGVAGAHAQPITGLYVGAGAGLNFLQDTELTTRGGVRNSLDFNGASTRGKATYDLGWGIVGSLGWGFGNGLRVEVEGSYRQNDVSTIRGFGPLPPFGRVGGSQNSYGVMANVLYDFDLTRYGIAWMQPYVGAGVGYQWVQYGKVRGTSVNAPVQLFSDDTDGRFAYQAILGVAFPIQSVPGLAITTEYRFLGTTEPRFDAQLRNPSTGAVLARGRVEADNFNHSMLVGLRYAFNPPRPPAPVAAPAVAPAPTRTYLVFFDWDRADLTDRARQIIAEAAQNSTRVQVTRIEVNGYTDRSGSPQYNQGLSVRRANAVAAELVRNGVPRNAIVTRGFGEENPLVPTADGVREPQNRRVEIILR